MSKHVFSDQRGRYGGKQEALIALWSQGTAREKNNLRQLIKHAIKKELADEDIGTFLNKLKNEGCGFVAGTSIILAHYEKKQLQHKFNQDYGINFYTTDGNVNFSELLLRFYQQERYRRHIPLTTLQFPLPYPGVRASDLRVNILRFSQQHGQPIIGRCLRGISQARLRNQLAQDKIIALTCYFSQLTLISCQPNWYGNSQINFHTVMITGYDENAEKFIVSSWGNKYYLASLPFYGAYMCY